MMARNGYHDLKVYLRERFLYINCSERCYIHSTNYDISAPINHGLKVIDNATMQTANETFTGSYVTLEIADTDTQFNTYQLNFLILAAEDLSSSLSAEFKQQILDALSTANQYAQTALSYISNISTQTVITNNCLGQEYQQYEGDISTTSDGMILVYPKINSFNGNWYVLYGQASNLNFEANKTITVSLIWSEMYKIVDGNKMYTNFVDNTVDLLFTYSDGTTDTILLERSTAVALGELPRNVIYQTTLKKALKNIDCMCFRGRVVYSYIL